MNARKSTDRTGLTTAHVTDTIPTNADVDVLLRSWVCRDERWRRRTEELMTVFVLVGHLAGCPSFVPTEV
jgi:hypothetical protein